MKQPYFSIVIPTKNRPALLADALSSALWQDFDDMEVIVSDNFNDERTKATVDKFANHPKLKYYRTSHEMNMLDHWEWASLKAMGKYVLIMPDRKVLYQGALQKLKTVTEKYPHINAFSYHVATFIESTLTFAWSPPHQGTMLFSTADLTSNFLSENLYLKKTFEYYFPKTLNGFFKAEYAQSIRSKFGQYFNTAGVTTPDFSSLFINLALNDEILYIGDKILISQGEQVSNGRNFGLGKVDQYLNMLHIDFNTFYEPVPVHSPFIYNWLTLDFLTIQQKVTANLSKYSVDWVNYYATLHRELTIKTRSDMAEEMKDYFKNSITIPLSNTDKEFQTQVKNRIARDEATITQPTFFDKLNRLPQTVQSYLTHHYPNNRFLNAKYYSILHAAGFKNTT